MNDIEIVFSNDDIIILNKPSGISVHGGPTVTGPVVTDFLIERFPELASVGDEPLMRPGIVHRLDKNTSGIMVVARNQKTFLRLKEIFQARLAEKKYWAIVCGRMKEKEGTVALPIGRIVSTPTRCAVDDGKRRMKNVRDALTEYRVLKLADNYSLVELVLKTGRMHQIRVHMSALRYPVACDTLYGGEKVCCPEGCNRQLLHAQSLSFSLEEGKRLSFEADPPEDFARALKVFE